GLDERRPIEADDLAELGLAVLDLVGDPNWRTSWKVGDDRESRGGVLALLARDVLADRGRQDRRDRRAAGEDERNRRPPGAQPAEREPGGGSERRIELEQIPALLPGRRRDDDQHHRAVYEPEPRAERSPPRAGHHRHPDDRDREPRPVGAEQLADVPEP